jgi:hypothetical protein
MFDDWPIGRAGWKFMKNKKSEVKNNSCIDRSHVPLAVLALAAKRQGAGAFQDASRTREP